MERLQELDEALRAYANATGIRVMLLEDGGKVLGDYGTAYPYCRLLHDAMGSDALCREQGCRSCQQAWQLGEEYISFCPGGLVLFAVPLADRGKYGGGVLAGPILLDYPELSAVDEVLQKLDVGVEHRTKLFHAQSALPVVDTGRVRHLARLLAILVSCVGVPPVEDLRQNSEKSMQQALIGSYIQRLKLSPEPQHDLAGLEEKMILSVIAGDRPEAAACLNKTLGALFLETRGSVDLIRARVVELFAHLSQRVMEVRRSADLSRLTDEIFYAIAQQTTFPELSFAAAEGLEKYLAPMLDGVKEGHSQVIEDSIRYICANYCGALSLSEVAAAVGINPSYLSSLFKREMGVGFSEYVRLLRLEHAKHLLRSTQMTVVEIAGQLGFESQSYFSAAFRRHTGQSPGQYRQQNEPS